MDSVCRVRTLVLHMEAHTNQVNLPSLLNNNNHPTTQARYSVAPARPDWPPVVSSGHLWPLSNSLSIYWHNHHLQKQHADLATCALEQTSQIVTNYHPTFLSQLIITLRPASVINIMTSSHFVRGPRVTHHHWQPHLHSVSCTWSRSLTLTLALNLSHSSSCSFSWDPQLTQTSSHSRWAQVHMLNLTRHTCLTTARTLRSRVPFGPSCIIPCAHVHTHSHLFSLISTLSIARIVPCVHIITITHSVRECCHILSRLDVTQLKEGKAGLSFVDA